MYYKWDWNWVWTYRDALIQATILTLWLNALILALGSLAGLGIAALRSSRLAILRGLAIVYIDIFRTLPILVLLVWFFFCAPILLGGVQISAIATATIVLSLNLSAFVAEIVRAGIEAVPAVHIETARASGLSQRQILRHITLPIALRNMVPPLVGQYMNSIKLSVLASVISVPELLHKTTDIISQTYRPLEFYTVLALIYLVILLPGTIWSRRLEGRGHLRRLGEGA